MYISYMDITQSPDSVYTADFRVCSKDFSEIGKLQSGYRKDVKISIEEKSTKNESTDKKEPKNELPELKVKKVIFSNPATIVFWSDNTKTVVKCGKDDTYDKEKGFYIACAKKLFGNDYKAVGKMNKALTMAETKEAE